MVLMRWMFIELGLDASLHIDLDVLDDWICAIYRGYLPVPFHNYYHCFSVAQMTYAFIWMLQLKNSLEDLDILALLVAAICHDMNHPGLNNTFQARSVSLPSIGCMMIGRVGWLVGSFVTFAHGRLQDFFQERAVAATSG